MKHLHFHRLIRNSSIHGFLHQLLLLFTGILCVFLPSCKQQSAPEIPIIRIYSDNPIIWGTKGACVLSEISSNDSISYPAMIKCRGGTSSKYNKHSYAVSFSENVGFGGLPPAHSWIINASYIDKTLMRHKLCYDLFRQMSSENIAPKCRYASLYINDIYQGIYLIMEKMDEQRLGLNITDSMAVIYKDPPVFYRQKVDFPEDSLNYFGQKFPAIEKSDRSNYAKQLFDFLNQSNDSVFSADISKWADLKNVADWHLLLMFTNNSDGIMKNFFLYKINAETPFRIAPWDYDHSFGRDGDNELNMMERELDINKSILFQRLMQLNPNGYKEKIAARWFFLRENRIFTEENMDTLIEQNKSFLDPHISENFTKWPYNGPWYFDDNNFEEEIEIIRIYVEKRLKMLDNRLNTYQN